MKGATVWKTKPSMCSQQILVPPVLPVRPCRGDGTSHFAPSPLWASGFVADGFHPWDKMLNKQARDFYKTHQALTTSYYESHVPVQVPNPAVVLEQHVRSSTSHYRIEADIITDSIAHKQHGKKHINCKCFNNLVPLPWPWHSHLLSLQAFVFLLASPSQAPEQWEARGLGIEVPQDVQQKFCIRPVFWVLDSRYLQVSLQCLFGSGIMASDWVKRGMVQWAWRRGCYELSPKHLARHQTKFLLIKRVY